ncbi:hypothetical protein PIB30_065578 [Stylosanthes scabra]|uniref:Ubiquitin-like protease family profile domain-containing protein n=1 Tax=Stylosanthes scabra TaxID=79078 RepID=A0ABU6UQ02_9FABA|nr:hypothetical protein [Stylosanthes scabra]
MGASVAANLEDYDPAKAFDLGLDTQPQHREIPVELYNLDDFSEETEILVTPTVPDPIVVPNIIAPRHSQINNDLKERCVIWALSKKEEIRYDTIFMIKGDWHYEVVRKQFRSMRNGKEIDLLTSMFRAYNDDYIDTRTRRPHSITSLVTDDHLKLIDKTKLITHRYIFALVLYAKHWWMYILDKEKKIFYVLDSKNKISPSQERTRINKFAEELQKFRKEIIWQIILSKENLYIQKAIDGAISTTIHRPSAVLQSPYVQVSTEDLKSY